MSAKRVLLIVMAVGAVVLAVGVGPGHAGTVQALPPQANVDLEAVTIPYAGTLADPAGQPVADGVYDFSFALYAAETGGEPLWSEVQEGVAVRSGQFATDLGRVTPIPASATSDSRAWLAVSVRGPREAAFTALTPRQRVSAAASATALSPTAAAACPHNHFGEIWAGWTGPGDGLWLKGNVGWSSGIFLVDNNGNGPAIWGYNNGGGNAVRGDAEGSGSIGVYGGSEQSAGVVGRSNTRDGVEGYSSASDVWAGVYGEAPHYGVFGRATTATWYGVFSDGAMGTTGDLWVGGNMTAVGSKSAVVRTDDGSRLLYSEESTQVWFSDYGFGTLHNGTAIILIDPVFAQTVNLQEPYHVFLQPYGNAELYVTDRTATQFQVHLRDGDPNVEFSYRIVAKRLGYEDDRLEPAPRADNGGSLYPEK
jgi:hypothetical protein